VAFFLFEACGILKTIFGGHMSARILIIEDDEAILKFLRRGLAYEGYQVDTATDGQSGLGLARDNPPDLVVLDLMLPGIDGMEVCRRLRR
jgi:two-component system response regulator MprA